MNYAQIQQMISAQCSELRIAQNNETAEIRERHRQERADLETKHANERQALNAQQMILWENYRGGESGPSKVVEHNALVAQMSLPPKIKLKHSLVSTTVDDMIEELEQRIAANFANIPGPEADKLLTANMKMRKSIIALGGTPKPDPTTGKLTGNSALSDSDMDALLDGTGKAP